MKDEAAGPAVGRPITATVQVSISWTCPVCGKELTRIEDWYNEKEGDVLAGQPHTTQSGEVCPENVWIKIDGSMQVQVLDIPRTLPQRSHSDTERGDPKP